jgi:hypothetical protein
MNQSFVADEKSAARSHYPPTRIASRLARSMPTTLPLEVEWG